jgi:hypothetical protein
MRVLGKWVAAAGAAGTILLPIETPAVGQPWRRDVTLHALLQANTSVRDAAMVRADLVLSLPDRRAAPKRPPARYAKNDSVRFSSAGGSRIAAPNGGYTHLAQRSGTRTKHVRFGAGQTSTSIKGTITGRELATYVLGAEAGQAMTITLKPSNLQTYFNVYEPGKGPGDQALATGSITGPMVPDLNTFKGQLPTSGQYTISVYMMRAAARRDEHSNYTLDVSISALGEATQRPPVQKDYADGLQGGPDYWEVKTDVASQKLNIHASASSAARVIGSVSTGVALRNLGCRMAEGRRWCRVETVNAPKLSGWTAGEFLRESSYTSTPAPKRDDTRFSGRNFNATGKIPCARSAGQPMGSCKFGVVRKGHGNGTITVFWPNGGTRVIFFENGRPANFDQSQADGQVRMNTSRNADLFTVTIGQQRFEIPEAVISGG